MIKYIHYGANAYDPTRFFPVKNSSWGTKPMNGGLWASREKDPFGWDAWCRENRYSVQLLKQYFRFTVSADSSILTLEDPEQLNNIPKTKPWKPKDLSWMETIEPGKIPSEEQLMQLYSTNPSCIDFEELVRNGIDAVELTNCSAFRDSLDIWDCNCILIMNPEIMLMYGKEASNRKQEIDRQHYTIPNQRPKDKHCGKI